MIQFLTDKVVVPAANLNKGSILGFSPSRDGNGNIIYMVVANITLPTTEVTPTRAAWQAWVHSGHPSVGTDKSYMIHIDTNQFEFNNINGQAPYGGLSFSNAYCRIVAETADASLYGKAFNDFLVYMAQTGAYSLLFEGNGPTGAYHMYKRN